MKSENITSMGTVAASVLASICCVGPLLFLVSGVSVGFLGNFTFLDPFRFYLLAAAFLMLSFSFWKLYVKLARCACDADIRARRISRTVFWTGTVVFVVAASFSKIALLFYG